tara:strand:+ start:3585 stop:3977 length:393 start_codon:yes stop_codon:yes gene_type:complete
MRLASIAAAALAAIMLSVASPAIAGASCQFELAPTVEMLEADKDSKFLVLDSSTPELLELFVTDLEASILAKTGKVVDLSDVVAVLLADISGEVFFGLVNAEGCLTVPMPLSQFFPEEKRSGWTPVGTFA